MKKILSTYLKYSASPGFISEKVAAIVSYSAILIIFPLDILSGSQISLHVLYVFPLTLIALHCSCVRLVVGALGLSIFLQICVLLTFHDVSNLIKFYLSSMVFLTNTTFVLIARFARTNTIEAERLATTDPLTKLLNRRALEIDLDNEIVRQRRYGGFFSVVLIDLDGFKSLNDSMGHQSGDKALVLLADVLRTQTRASDTISRIGGDEFVILMPNTPAADCETICQTLCNKISTSMSEACFAITASIGYTTIEHAPEMSLDVLLIADKAMYQAKTNGKDRVVRGYHRTYELSESTM